MIMKQILRGLYFIHSNKILHRDMKAANILITKNGVLKLADFGLARAFGGYNQPNRYTNRVVTLWYRPPELLLGERNYGPPIDIWGAGCIMAEMWTRSPIMQGVNEQHQLNLICQFCGSIVPETFPGCETLELYKQIRLRKDLKRKVKERLKPWVKDETALELLDKMLQIHPSRRIDSDNALDHDFFWSDPMPCELKILDTVQTSNFTYINSNVGKQEIRPQKITRNEEQYFDRVF
ncbi:cyclin-dependent kinase 9 [Caerostris extrusa]|uniref:Cyclin-dependent kinase 9 n=1 Tax=Caerostris extrusa TaxID=172846 RepID=A0AAV4XFL8_CAEEX|nr:cyclin-dependent kinase 9 [Caerostris extrusa]